MTDDMLRDADPYQPEVMHHLAGADQVLLDDIVRWATTLRAGFAVAQPA